MPEPKQEIDLSQYEQDLEKQRKKAGDEAREKERLRVQGINDIYEKFKAYVPEFIRRKAVDEGMPLQEYQDIVLKRIGDGSLWDGAAPAAARYSSSRNAFPSIAASPLHHGYRKRSGYSRC